MHTLALWEQGIRQALPLGVKRHEWKGAHGYRAPAFKSRAEQVMRPANVEILMGQLKEYYESSKEWIVDFLRKAADLLFRLIDANDIQEAILMKKEFMISSEDQLYEFTNKSERLLNDFLSRIDQHFETKYLFGTKRISFCIGSFTKSIL